MHQAKGACCASSSLVIDSSCHSLVRANLPPPTVITYFCPFNENEVKQYLLGACSSLSVEQLKHTAHIPSLVRSVIYSAASSACVRLDLSRMIKDQLNALKDQHIRVSCHDETGSTCNTWAVHEALFVAVAFGCDSLMDTHKYTLIDTGFCYVTSMEPTLHVSLVYPNSLLLSILEEHVRSISSIIGQFDKGAGLEFVFFVAARTPQGLCLQHVTNAPEIKTIPPVQDVWVQPKYGETPDYVGNDYSKCMMMKLAKDHFAIDFLILDCTPTGVQGRTLYFVQVSVTKYESCPMSRKYNAINVPTKHLSSVSPKAFYCKKLNVDTRNCAYVYVSSAKSSFSSVHGEDFYSLCLNYSSLSY